jgi:methylenetetrahydrofolate reductase (NADPH)
MFAMQPPPLFVDVTWTLAAGKRALETLIAAKAVCGLDVQMHLSCTDLTRETAEGVLADAAQAGIRGLMILRGDPPADRAGGWQPTEDGFSTPAELVTFVRQRFGDRFSIAVAGHPAGHPDHAAAPRDAQIRYLRDKVLPAPPPCCPLRSLCCMCAMAASPLCSWPHRTATDPKRKSDTCVGVGVGLRGGF